MIRENVLPQIVKKNLGAIFVARGLSILAEVSASDERTKILADRLLVKADELAARAATISGGFIENPDERKEEENVIGKIETHALKLASVPSISNARTQILKTCRNIVPEPGSRGTAFLYALESVGNNSKFSLEASEFLAVAASFGKSRFLLSQSEIKSISDFFDYSGIFFRELALCQKVDYSVTTLTPILTDVIARFGRSKKKIPPREKAIILAAEAVLKRGRTAN